MLPLRDKAARVVFPRLGSNMIPPVRAADDVDRFKDLLKSYPFGGLILFNGHVDRTPHDLAELQDLAAYPLLVGADIERGAGQQIVGATLFPHARALGLAGTSAVRTFAAMTAKEALSAGIHIAFGPVADVNANPRNPIIGIRAFDTSPESVAGHVSAFIGAAQPAGLMTTAKHFPGHGNTATDSHAELPVVPTHLDKLLRSDLIPFQHAIRDGVELIMTAHVKFPALDETHPATTSRSILTGLLRETMGFEGVIVTDSLIMEAIHRATNSDEERAALLLNAGVDILLDPPDPPSMVEGIIGAVQSGSLAEGKLDAALHRIERLRRRVMDRFGNTAFTTPYGMGDKNHLGAAEHVEAAQSFAALALRATPENTQWPRPDAALLIEISPYPPSTLAAEHRILRNRIETCGSDQIRYAEVNPATPQEEREEIMSQCDLADTVLACVVAKPAAWHAFGLPDDLAGFTRRLIANQRTVFVALGDPGLFVDFPGAAGYVCTYSDALPSQEALFNWLMAHGLIPSS